MRLTPIAIVIGTFALCLSSQSYATEHHTAQALEHSAMATAHGQDGHAEQLLKHAEEGLKHAEAAEKEHAEAHAHMTEAVNHLKQAIDHAKKVMPMSAPNTPKKPWCICANPLVNKETGNGESGCREFSASALICNSSSSYNRGW